SGESRFRDLDRFAAGGIVVAADLQPIEPAEPPFDDVEVAEQVESGQVEAVRPFYQSGPFAGRGQRRGGQAEVLVGVVGMDEQGAFPFVHVVFDALLPRAHNQSLRRGTVGRIRRTWAALWTALPSHDHRSV